MKKIFSVMLAVIVLSVMALAACGAELGITLDKTELALYVGESQTLTATVTPEAADKTVTWTTSDEAVATVENGVVTAVGNGTATVTATTANGKKSASCTVTVSTFVHVDSVSLDKTETSIFVGATETLTATVLPANATDKTVAWSTSDKAVATVENGVVTGVAGGTATITVTSADGSKTATCAVTVKIATNGIQLSKTELTLVEGKTETLTATVLPEDAADKSVTWTTSNAAVATVENGVVNAVANGTAVITATAAGDKIATCTVTVITPLENLARLSKEEHAKGTLTVVTTSDLGVLTNTYAVEKTATGYKVDYSVQKFSTFGGVGSDGNFTIPEGQITTSAGSAVFDASWGNKQTASGVAVDVLPTSLTLGGLTFAAANFENAKFENGTFTANVKDVAAFLGSTLTCTDMTVSVSYTDAGINGIRLGYTAEGSTVQISYLFT